MKTTKTPFGMYPKAKVFTDIIDKVCIVNASIAYYTYLYITNNLCVVDGFFFMRSLSLGQSFVQVRVGS